MPPWFWFPAGDNSSLAERIERGPKAHAPVPSWQFDRGRFENYLGDRHHEAGIDLFGATRVTGVEIGDPHRVTITPREGGEPTTVQARWIIDASGRSWIHCERTYFSPRRIGSPACRLSGSGRPSASMWAK